jgi:hypothetical protein
MILANLALLAVCLLGQGMPLAAVVVVGAAVYGATWFIGDRWICMPVKFDGSMMVP